MTGEPHFPPRPDRPVLEDVIRKRTAQVALLGARP